MLIIITIVIVTNRIRSIIIIYYIILHYIISYCIIWHYIALYCITLQFISIYYTMLLHEMWAHICSTIFQFQKVPGNISILPTGSDQLSDEQIQASETKSFDENRSFLHSNISSEKNLSYYPLTIVLRAILIFFYCAFFNLFPLITPALSESHFRTSQDLLTCEILYKPDTSRL